MLKRLLMIVIGSLLLCSCARLTDPRVIADVPVSGGKNPVDWAPDGRRLLYIHPENVFGPAMLLDLDQPDQPKPLTKTPTHSLAFSQDGQSFAYVGDHPGPGRPESTVFVQSLAGGEPVDLFPDGGSVHGVSGAIFVDRWLDERTLAYIEGMGTGVRALWLVDVPTRKMLLPVSTDYVATEFTWTKDGSRVAGQLGGGPPHFWLWDRPSGEFIKPASPLPGTAQWFEAWAPDGRSVLFTAWTGGIPYWDRTAVATLYRWHLADSRVEKVAEHAGRADTSGDYRVFIHFGERPTLMVTRAADGQTVWSEPLGKWERPADGPPRWPSRPLLQNGYIAYAHGDGAWYVSPLERRAPKALVKGSDLQLQWSPDARHLSVLGGDPARLRVLVNPAR